MKKIVIFLPFGYTKRDLKLSNNIAKALICESKIKGIDIEVIFSYPTDEDINLDFVEMEEIFYRETKWEIVSYEESWEILSLLNRSTSNLKKTEYIVPYDGMNNFLDADVWIVLSDRLDKAILPIKDYICINYGFVERYYPEIFGNKYVGERYVKGRFQNLRNSKKVLVPIPFVKEDVISYAGIYSNKIEVMGMNFNFVEFEKKNNYYGEYFVWVTNLNDESNISVILKNLVKYYEEYNGELRVVILNENTIYSNEENSHNCNENISKLQNEIAKNESSRGKVVILENITDFKYLNILSYSKFIMYSKLYSEAIEVIIEAACLGVPSISEECPFTKYINEYLNLNITLFDFDKKNDLINKLIFMEENYMNIELPKKELLKKYSYQSRTKDIWKLIFKDNK